MNENGSSITEECGDCPPLEMGILQPVCVLLAYDSISVVVVKVD